MKRMKRMSLLALLLLVGAGLLMVAYADQEHSPRHGYGKHEGMGHGTAPGKHKGMGFGTAWGMWPGMMPFWDKVPEDKQKQMEQLHRSIGPAMMRKMMDEREQGQQLQSIMHAFPINHNAVEEQWAKLNQTRSEAFKIRMVMIAQMQEILGETLWANMRDDRR
jgi:Spy/CpxP family protein refolding chaperone